LIVKRLFEKSGETQVEGNVARCPGLNLCSQFTKRFPKVAGITWEEKAEEAVAGCSKCNGVIPDGGFEPGNEIDFLTDEIERLISLDNCRIQVDWEKKDYDIFYLFQVWRNTEINIENIRQSRMQSFLKGWFKDT